MNRAKSQDAVGAGEPFPSNRNEPNGSVARDAQIQVHKEPAPGGFGGVRCDAEQTGDNDRDATTRNSTARGNAGRPFNKRSPPTVGLLFKKINHEAIKSRDKTRSVLQRRETNAANIAKFRMKQVEQIRYTRAKDGGDAGLYLDCSRFFFFWFVRKD